MTSPSLLVYESHSPQHTKIPRTTPGDFFIQDLFRDDGDVDGAGDLLVDPDLYVIFTDGLDRRF